MRHKILATAVGAGLLSVGAWGAAPAYAATSATLSCVTTVGSTSGTAKCTGSGTWRVKAYCDYETDKYSGWITQTGGTVSATVPQCTWNITDVTIEFK